MSHELHATIAGEVMRVRSYTVTEEDGTVAHKVAVAPVGYLEHLQLDFYLSPEEAIELRDQLSTCIDAFPIGVVS